MRQLLQWFVAYFGFLYESPNRRIVNSGTPHARGAEAFLELRSSTVRWKLAKERFSLVLGVGAVDSDEIFSTELVQQYLERLPEPPPAHLGTGMTGLAWIEANVDKIESIFADPEQAQQVTAELVRLSKENADRRWGPLPKRDP